MRRKSKLKAASRKPARSKQPVSRKPRARRTRVQSHKRNRPGTKKAARRATTGKRPRLLRVPIQKARKVPAQAKRTAARASAAKRIPVALQLYSVREECKKDLAGVLKAVAWMGYAGVEFAGYYDWTAMELRHLLDDLGLRVAGSHLKLEQLLGDEFKKTVEFNRILENRFLIVPGLAKERTATKAAWLESARLLNEISGKLKPLGMVTGYHNHHTEFTPLEGELPWDLIFGHTIQDVVMQVDTGNALFGGADVVPFVQKYPGRARTVHLKEHSKTNPKAIIGEGDVDWKTCFKLCEGVGATEWYIVEQESYAHPPLECVALCLQKLRAMGK